jgi:anti-anti-sigma factor
MLKVHTQTSGDIAILHLKGRVVIGETEVLREAVLAQGDARLVVVDFARVSGIDAHGLGVLLELREWTQAREIEFRLMNVTRSVQHILEITCLDTVFEITSGLGVLPNPLPYRPFSTEENAVQQ